jgi:XTP/dITP diphosphohydrolase
MQKIAICTTNPGKIDEFQRILTRELDPIALDIDEIQALDTENVCRAKAKIAFASVRRPVLVDDTGFELAALGGFPGALVTWVIGAGGTSLLHRMLPSGASPRAMAVTSIGFADQAGVQVFTGRVEGEVIARPRGRGGFGFDEIFVPGGSGRTFAELSEAEKDALSPRRIALDALRAHLESI